MATKKAKGVRVAESPLFRNKGTRKNGMPIKRSFKEVMAEIGPEKAKALRTPKSLTAKSTGKVASAKKAAPKVSRLAGAAVRQMGQLGRQPDSRGGMEGSYDGKKLPKKLGLNTQHSATGRHTKPASFHADEGTTAKVKPRKSAAAQHTLQRGKKGGSFYVVNGRKVYAKK